MNARVPALIALGVVFVLAVPGQADDYTDSLKLIPESANAVSVIDVDALYKSPRSLREGWAKEQEIAGSIHLPSSVRLLVMGYDVNQGNKNDSWRVGLATLKKQVPMKDIATKEQGQIENVSGQTVVHSHRNCYFVDMGPASVGISYPADRQRTARWLHFAKGAKKPVVSTYLQNAVAADRGEHIITAFDMEEMVEPRIMKSWLNSTKTMQNQPPRDVTDMVKTFATLRGVRFSARVYDQSILAKVSLDFGADPKEYAKVAKPLFLEALDDFGAALDDFRNCQVLTEGHTITLKTNIGDDDLAKVMSLLLLPRSETGPGDDAAEPTGPDAVLIASQRYYRAIRQILQDLRRKNRAATNYNQTALWHANYAKKIEEMPITNVDKDLVQFGANTAGNLRALAASLRGEPLELNVLQSQKRFEYFNTGVQPVMFGGGGGFFGWGWQLPQTFYQDNFAEIRTKQAEAIQRGYSDRNKIWQTMDAEADAIREKMREKFKVDFDAAGK
jgi:hypothetical protein